MIKTVALAAASVLVIGSQAVASDAYEKMGQSGNWSVWANLTSKGCFIQNRDNNGNLVQMGIRTNKDKVAFLGVWDHDESVMEPGEKRDMKLDIDGNVYTFTAIANSRPVTEGYTGGYMWLNNPDFINDIENGQTLTVHTDTSEPLVVDLTGTKNAIAAARDCFAKINS